MIETKELRHKVRFEYDAPCELGSLEFSLAPLPFQSGMVTSQNVSVDPQPSCLSWAEKEDGSRSVSLTFDEPVEAWSLVNLLKIQTDEELNLRFENIDAAAATFPFSYSDAQRQRLVAYLDLPPADPDLIEILKALPNTTMPTLDALQLVCDQVADYQADYRSLETNHQQDEEQHAELLVRTFRAIKLAARSVVGYEVCDEPQLGTKAQAFIPGVGWVTFDQQGVLPFTEFLALKSGADFDDAKIGNLDQATHDFTIETILPEIPKTGESVSLAAAKSDGMTKTATRVDQLLKRSKLEVTSLIQVAANEEQDEQRTSWSDIVSDLNDRLQNTGVETNEQRPTRLHNIHTVSGKNAGEIVQRSRFLTLAFPSLTRLVGLERFEGPYLSARDEALQVPSLDDQATFKARHDLQEPFQTLPNALLERAILARLSKGSAARFAPKANTLLEDSFRLPSVLWNDLLSLCDWLSAEDLHIEASWFAAHFEQRYPVLSTLKVPAENDSSPVLEIRPAYRSGVEQHQFSLLEFKLNGDGQDRFEVAVNGWMLPMKRMGQSKVSAFKMSDLSADLDVVVYDKWQRSTVVDQCLRIANGNKITLSDDATEGRRLISPPPHPDLSHTLDLAWAQHWGGNGRRF